MEHAKEMKHELLSVLEVSKILKVSRNTVYEMVKRGDIPHSKVGKQMRINRQDVETYLTGSRTIPQQTEHPSSGHAEAPQAFLAEGSYDNEFIVCGQNICLDILIDHLNTQNGFLQLYRSYAGSYDSLYALYHGRINAAFIHLWDGDQNEYNITYVKKMMPGIPTRIIRIGRQQHGYYVKKGNPKGIEGWGDLNRRDITIANREKGSGTRVLFDEHLRLMNVTGENIIGYSTEFRSPTAVASAVSHGTADLALGSETGYRNVSGIDFIPLQQECYDLVFRKTDTNGYAYRQLFETLTSPAYKQNLENLGGYDTEETGKRIV